jgi:hypothetical protein
VNFRLSVFSGNRQDFIAGLSEEMYAGNNSIGAAFGNRGADFK